ncbi:DUF805 domain-containing protein [Sphingomonas sp.]|uniref:DUF805 domain-containing protein n=1 Tax=Sphingomonas sp. TaxID=28214 RepID=UPI001B1806E2|nr:DUF805 domain-containing protein [Sphingomonas sp.]MBO9711390.1 DUF805 domain-containing protein [Sphingomonas sp.]
MLREMTAAPFLRGIALGLKPFRDWLRFEGRSTRSEVIAFLIVYMLGHGMFLPWRDGPAYEPFSAAWELLTYLPLPALFYRRAQDLGRPGLWGVAPVLLMIPTSIAAFLVPQSDVGPSLNVGIWHAKPALTGVGVLVDLGFLAVVFALWAIALIGPAASADRFGRNPRAIP